MAAAVLSHFFPSSYLFPPHHLLLIRFNHYNLRLQCRPLTIACSASARRSRKKSMSDAELCDGLRRFVDSVGLPRGHVPSTKELSMHGRKDLANIVRRRGHKLIKELLQNSIDRETDHPDLKENIVTMYSIGQGMKAKNVPNLSEEDSMMNKASDPGSVTIDDTSTVKTDQALTSATIEPSLREKAQKFVKYGELDDDEGYLTSISKMNGTQGYPTHIGNRADEHSIKHGEVDLQHLSRNSNVEKVMNGNVTVFEGSTISAPGNNLMRDYISSDKLPLSTADCEVSTMRNRAEIDDLRFQLHQKELELSLLKEQIEKEKEALSILQTKAEIEISKAEKLVLEIDAELQSAEESLSGLKKVHIEYWGNGEVVEVAGSFNGWHQPIKMDLDATESRTCWLATLWLYPGVYEIKFIVDGQWTVDPRSESISRGGIINNVLQVSR